MTRVANFSAGPSVLPVSVLERAQKELLNYKGTGMSVMEMSHRSSEFQEIIEEAEALLRELLKIPENYHVLFLQGGASLQFSMVPFNLLTTNHKADYIMTGSWSKKAMTEASKLGDINVITPSNPLTEIPSYTQDDFQLDADYVHITTNNTIEGTRFSELPNTGTIPLVADMSSHILSEEIDVNQFGLIYAGAQKNLGPAGVTVVIVRDDLTDKAFTSCPTMLNYTTYVKNQSLFNTPPTFSIYIMKMVLEWIKELGGVTVIEQHNKEKAKLLYDTIDQSKLFNNHVNPKNRSHMNIPFSADSEELNKKFLQKADEKGLKNLKGHRSVGGMRASLYNAMPLEDVKKLTEFMKEFELVYQQVLA
ncbi:3-phosphoserine/phosphohydroxythreonine transaminase [Rossellomorea sp. BNER]|uniref:3-phosphoserine/phosphohydroxythreonine transaminase n=1 Tax=Rossellomorea sp. BNER TaxID=2962031 RepID=UPI003AF24191|nr:3-phosphoserine/phosphohydroxythreonine transaminase [Rossellomorea sp. BNER]